MKYVPISSSNLQGSEMKYLQQCIESNWISSLGSFVKDFENKFSTYVERNYSMACSNGTTALHLALEALQIGPGDEVIVPSFTFIATVNAILYTGATPVFVDIEKETWNLDASKIEEIITKRTKAILFVNVYGNPANINELIQIGEKHHVRLIEDNAEALGGVYHGKKLGGFGDISCHSFYGNKLITCGEGGMVSTNSKEIAEKIKMLRDHGMSPSKRYYHIVKGYNYRMTNLQAAVGLAQFERLDFFLEERERIFHRYTENLRNCTQVKTPFKGDNYRKPVNWLYTILVSREIRSKLANHLKDQGIDSRPTFVPIHKMPYLKEYNDLSLPVTEEISASGLSLPTYIDLKNGEVDYICDKIRSYFS